MEEVSRWLWQEWARADGYTLDESICRTRYASQRDTIPQMLLAVRGGQPVWVAPWNKFITTICNQRFI